MLEIRDTSEVPTPCTETIFRKQSSVFGRQLSETTAQPRLRLHCGPIRADLILHSAPPG